MNERILIIEDDEAIVKTLRRALAYEGYVVDSAVDGESGLLAARDNTPDLVILDWMLPGIDGLEATRRIVGDPSTDGCRVLVLTTFDHDENVFAALMDAARVCSLQQVTEAFFEVGGQYRRNV